MILMLADDCIRDWELGDFFRDTAIKLLNEISLEAHGSRKVLDSHDIRQALAVAAEQPIRIGGRLMISAHHASLDVATSWEHLLWHKIAYKRGQFQERPGYGNATWLKECPAEDVKQGTMELSEEYHLSEIAGDIRTMVERERAKILMPLQIPFVRSEVPAIRLFEPRPSHSEHQPATKSTNQLADAPLGNDAVGTTPRDDHEFRTCSQIAKIYSVDKEPLRKRLERWRRQNLDNFREVANPKTKESQYLYKVSTISEIISELKLSGERPSK